jgi:hypothetical protein
MKCDVVTDTSSTATITIAMADTSMFSNAHNLNISGGQFNNVLGNFNQYIVSQGE